MLVGVPVVVVERAERVQSIHSGHVTVVWKLAGRVMEVSLHGFEHRTQAIKMAQALIAQSKDCGGADKNPGADVCDLVFPAGDLR